MKLRLKFRNLCYLAASVALSIFLASQVVLSTNQVFAEDPEYSGSHFVTIYDNGSTLTVKTEASTVKDILEKANVSLDAADIVEPALETSIASGNFNINIYRARPAVVVDGTTKSYVMTASFDAKQIAREAGFTIYDGDEIKRVDNTNFLEAGAASQFEIIRNGGRTITVEESLPYATETKYDYALAKGETRLERAGEDGRKTTVYNVKFENNIEVARDLVSETITLAPVSEIVVVGARPSIRPEWSQCAAWAREAGVSEADLPAALDLIYRESGCRVDATNASSGAYGIPQALPGNKMASMGADWQTNPVTQIRWMTQYVNGRYGGWQQALNFWWCTGSCTNLYGTVQKNGTWY